MMMRENIWVKQFDHFQKLLLTRINIIHYNEYLESFLKVVTKKYLRIRNYCFVFNLDLHPAQS